MTKLMPGPGILHIIGGNDRGKQFDLNKPEIRIGRGTDQDVVLADIAVSRRHVTIVMEGPRFRLKDLGSGNGSLVNGQRIDTVILNDGDQIEIGNTLMRFDHAPSRPIAAPAAPSVPPGYPPPGSFPGMAPPGYPPPSGYPPPGYPSASYSGMPPGYPPPGYPPPGYSAPGPAYPPPGYPPPAGYAPSYGGMPGDPNYGAPGMPPPAPSYLGPSSPPRMTAARSPIGTPVRKLVVFGAMGVLSLSGIVAIVSRTVFAQPVVVASEAEELYRQGLRLFAAGDYELAKGKFNEAAQQAQDAPEPRRYVRLCDTEMQARVSLKNAERALVNRRYAEAVRALDGVESTSVYYDQAARQRKETAPKAAAEMIDEARRLAQDNPDEARSRLKSALELDPNNSDGRDLLNRLRIGGPLPTSAAPASPSRAPVENTPPSPATVAAIRDTKPAPVRDTTKEPSRRSSRPSNDDDADLATVKVGKGASVAPVAAPDSKAAMAAYKARDFSGAVKLLRQDSMKQQQEKQALKMLEFANQVQQLQQLADKAQADEGKNPAQAVKEYEQAIQLDQKLGKGVHGSYFKQRIGGLGLQAAKQAFQEGKYEAAFQAAQAAQRSGGDASSFMKQLEQKASELISQGVNAQKTNLPQAKTYWRTVLKMVPSSSSNYTKAYSLLNSAAAPKRDEDED